MMRKSLKTVSLLIAAVTMVSASALLAGCGNSGNKTATTAPATVAATTAANGAQGNAVQGNAAQGNAAQGNAVQGNGEAQNQNGGSAGTRSGGGDSASNGHSINEVWYAGISEQDAGMQALAKVAPQGRITYTETGYFSYGDECWNINVTDVNGDTYSCCVSSDNFYSEKTGSGSGETSESSKSIYDDYFANVSEQEAGQTALANIGEGWIITNTYQSSYQGVDAWAIVLSNEAEGQTRTAYVNGSDCYFE